MIKYYIIGNANGDAANALKSHQDIEDVGVLEEEKQIWKIPYEQNYEGIAVVVKENAILSTNFDPNNFVESRKPMFFSEDKSVYVINCEQSKFTTIKLDRLDDYMSFQLVSPHRWGNSNELANLFGLPVNEPEFDEVKGWIAPEPELKNEE